MLELIYNNNYWLPISATPLGQSTYNVLWIDLRVPTFVTEAILLIHLLLSFTTYLVRSY